MRPRRGLGLDGISTDLLCKLPCVVTFVVVLFSLIFQSIRYPTMWGTAIITSLLKPGKPANAPTSLRGIRLLCRIAAWFGQVLDQIVGQHFGQT